MSFDLCVVKSHCSCFLENELQNGKIYCSGPLRDDDSLEFLPQQPGDEPTYHESSVLGELAKVFNYIFLPRMPNLETGAFLEGSLPSSISPTQNFKWTQQHQKLEGVFKFPLGNSESLHLSRRQTTKASSSKYKFPTCPWTRCPGSGLPDIDYNATLTVGFSSTFTKN